MRASAAILAGSALLPHTTTHTRWYWLDEKLVSRSQTYRLSYNALTRQYTALMATEQVEIAFTEDGIAALARIAAEVNRAVENIGARRLYTVLERVFEDLSFTAPDRGGDKVTVDAGFVETYLGDLARSTDLSRYVL